MLGRNNFLLNQLVKVEYQNITLQIIVLVGPNYFHFF